MTKFPSATENKKVITQKRDQNIRLHSECTDLEHSVGVTQATQMVWITSLWAQPSHFQKQLCNQMDI